MNRIALAIMVVMLLSGCAARAGSPDDKPEVVEPEGTLTLSGARNLWQQSGPASYRYVLRQECFCPEEALQPVVVTVIQEAVTELAVEKGGGPVPDGIRENARTIPGWFDYVEAWQKRDPARLEVSYDPDTGMPSRIFIDRNARMSDDEITWHLGPLHPGTGDATP